VRIEGGEAVVNGTKVFSTFSADAAVFLIYARFGPGVRGIGEKEAAIIKLGREAIGKHRVRRSTYAKAIELFGAETLVNLVALMGSYAATAMSLAVFAQQLPDGAKSKLD